MKIEIELEELAILIAKSSYVIHDKNAEQIVNIKVEDDRLRQKADQNYQNHVDELMEAHGKDRETLVKNWTTQYNLLAKRYANLQESLEEPFVKINDANFLLRKMRRVKGGDAAKALDLLIEAQLLLDKNLPKESEKKSCS